MAKILKEFPSPSRHKNSIYPWDEWFDGQIRLLKRGVDFKCQVVSLQSLAYVNASRRSGKLHIGVSGDEIVLQFVASNGKP